MCHKEMEYCGVLVSDAKGLGIRKLQEIVKKHEHPDLMIKNKVDLTDNKKEELCYFFLKHEDVEAWDNKNLNVLLENIGII